MLGIVKAGMAVLGVVGASLLPPLAAHRAQPQTNTAASSVLSQCLLLAEGDAQVLEGCAALMKRPDLAIPHRNVTINAIFSRGFR